MMRASEGTRPALEFRDVCFAYPQEAASVLDGASLRVDSGEFVLLTGGTGSGKTTLLRLAKHELAPVGTRSGEVRVFGRGVEGLSVRESCELVGYVFQSPENQIVCDTVWHELAFGLENLGMEQAEMRRRLAEVCVYLGIEGLFRRRCDELSGGQRQTVALAAVLAMRPRLLLLDEPTSMLDPVAEKEFLSLLFRANRELGLTVVVATHEPAAMVDYATSAYTLERGSVRPVALRDLRGSGRLQIPREGASPRECSLSQADTVLRIDDAWARYGREGDWVLRGCDLDLREGEVRALVGGNGGGKSTLLAVAARMLRVRRGKVWAAPGTRQALLPQEPKTLLGCETVREELLEWQESSGYDEGAVAESLRRIGLSGCESRHPYDLSGGQQQLLALEKLLLTGPDLLLLDEPTKGLDMSARQALARRVRELGDAGCAVLVATHDMAFVEAVAQRVSMLFDGQVGEGEPTGEFLERSWMWRV